MNLVDKTNKLIKVRIEKLENKIKSKNKSLLCIETMI